MAMSSVNFAIDNMHCGSCIRRVMQTLNALPSTHAEEVHVGGARVRTEISPAEIERALSAVGYPARVQNEAG